MATRVEAADVEEIIEVESGISLTPFINTANLLVTDVCSDSDYSAAKLEQIELWLSAHFYAVRDPRVSSEGAGGVTTTFQGQTGMRLEASIYGQHALLLDTEGNLAALNVKVGKPRAGVSWLGTDLE